MRDTRAICGRFFLFLHSERITTSIIHKTSYNTMDIFCARHDSYTLESKMHITSSWTTSVERCTSGESVLCRPDVYSTEQKTDHLQLHLQWRRSGETGPTPQRKRISLAQVGTEPCSNAWHDQSTSSYWIDRHKVQCSLISLGHVRYLMVGISRLYSFSFSHSICM